MTVSRLRPAVLAAALATAGLGGLLALEHVTPSTTPATVIEVVKSNHSTSHGSNGNHTKHCTDGKGKDAAKNKHCAAVSGAQ